MPIIISMPKLSPTMSEGTLVKWHKKVGDAIEPGDLLIEIATDKATVEHNAIDRGWLRKIFIGEGKEASVNQPIALITETKDENIEGFKLPEPVVAAAKETKKEVSGATAAVKEVAPQAGMMRQPAFVPEAPLDTHEFEYPTGAPEQHLRASPLAKRLAKEKGLDLSTVKGTGPNQRIMKRDLEKALPAGKVTFGHREPPEFAPGSYEELSLSPVRKIISQRLQEAKTYIPHFYVNQEIDAEPLVTLHEQLRKADIKVSLNDLVVRACALALRQYPAVNAGFNSVNQTIIQFKTIDIAIAVGIEEGVITPIVRHADHKNLGEISAEIKELAKRAREGKLHLHEYKGGSFTVSNLGMYGVTDFQAIINPPQAAILAVSAVRSVPVVKEQIIQIGKRMNINLSVDHRVVDGVAAALFIRSVQSFLETPALLLI